MRKEDEGGGDEGEGDGDGGRMTIDQLHDHREL